MNRRQLLAALGLGSGSLFLPSLLGRGARAEGDPPLRVVIFYTLHGAQYSRWKMRPGGNGDGQDWEARLGGLSRGEWSDCLEPLYDVREDITVLDGLQMTGPLADIAYDAHPLGQIHALTGAPLEPIAGFVAGSTAPSVDQLIAAAIARDDRFASLEYGPGEDPGTSSPIWTAQGTTPPVETDPNAAFQRLFPGVDPNQGQDLAAVFRRQSSVLDLVGDRYAALAPRLSGEDRIKLEVHRDLVRSTERRLESLRNLACATPNPPDGQWYEQSTAEAYDDKYAAYVDIIAAVLACDLSRVVTIQMTELANERFGAPAGDVHLDFAHSVWVSQSSSDHMVNYHRVHAEQFRELVERLRSVPEGSGSLLDSTVVVWCSELADGAHSFAPWPVVVAGGRCAGWEPGRYVHWAPTVPGADGEFGGTATGGVPHNQFLVSLCRSVGVDVNSVGLTEARYGGRTYPMTGSLPMIPG